MLNIQYILSKQKIYSITIDKYLIYIEDYF